MRYRLEQDPVPGPDAAPRPHLRFRRQQALRVLGPVFRSGFEAQC
jgi:hypothetical protein